MTDAPAYLTFRFCVSTFSCSPSLSCHFCSSALRFALAARVFLAPKRETQLVVAGRDSFSCARVVNFSLWVSTSFASLVRVFACDHV